MHYTYTAVFVPTEDKKEFYCSVPDLPGCITTARTLEESVEMITDAASLWLVSAEDDGREIPEPTAQPDMKNKKGAYQSLICIDTIAYRAEIDTHAVRKNVSLPAWMASLADKRGINCSQVLQDALKVKLQTA